jgi:hypothetical protein
MSRAMRKVGSAMTSVQESRGPRSRGQKNDKMEESGKDRGLSQEIVARQDMLTQTCYNLVH